MSNSTKGSLPGIGGSTKKALVPSLAIHDRSISHGAAALSSQQSNSSSDGDNKFISSQGGTRRSKIRNFFRRNQPKEKAIAGTPEPNTHDTPTATTEAGNVAYGLHDITVAPVVTETESTANSAEFCSNIFLRNVTRPSNKIDLQQPGRRIDTTPQLVSCISVLNSALFQHSELSLESGSVQSMDATSKDIPTDCAQSDWVKHIRENPDEQTQIRWLLTRMIEEFSKDIVKDSSAFAEVVLLGPVLDGEQHRNLLSYFINKCDQCVIMDVDLLHGLVLLIQCAAEGYLFKSDLVKIMSIIRKHLQDMDLQSSEHPYYLILALSRILDVMAQHGVKGVDRVEQHEPLAAVLRSLQESSDPFLVYQALYASQALQYIPDDETAHQAMMRHSGVVAEGLVNISGVVNLDLNEFLGSLGEIQKTVVETIGIAKSRIEGARSLIESGQDVLASIRQGISSGRKRAWYPAIIGASTLVREGRLADFKVVVLEAACRNSHEFQWGICQLLGEIALDHMWESTTRQQAVNFLVELYSNDPYWGQDTIVKSWMLTILHVVSERADQGPEVSPAFKKQYIDNADAVLIDKPYPLLSRFAPPQVWPLLHQVQEIPYVERDLQLLRINRLQEYNQNVYIPPLAKANLQASDKEAKPLMDLTKEFLDSHQQVFLILGDSGAGKSTFNRQLESELWKKYTVGGPIPLFINLPAIKEPDENMIEKQLRNHNFSEAKVKELKEHRELVLICDGFDEAQLRINLHMTNRLNQEGQPHTKLIISCRSTHLGQDYRTRFQPQTDRYSGNAASLYTEAVIVPFSSGQIKDYVDQFVRDPEVHILMGGSRVWSTEDYMGKLQSVPNLMELVRNPFLLSLSLRALPHVVKSAEDFANVKVTRLTLYHSFIDQWLDTNRRRLENMTLSREAEVARIELLEDDFTMNAIAFSKDLAAAIFREQGGNPIVHYSPRGDRETWKRRFFGPEPDTVLLRESSPISRAGMQHKFVHRSLLEYFYSRHVYEFMEKSMVSGLSYILADHPLSHRNLVMETSIVQFLAEHVQHDFAFKQALHQLIDLSKSDSEASQAAANAVTILFKSGVRLNSVDMRGARIPGADLSEGELDSVQLQGADLTNVNFSRSWLRQADFSHATMLRAQFGEWPFLEVDTEPTACAYSMDCRTLVLGFSKGGIIFHDTATWEITLTLPGHLKAITAIAFSPTGQQLFSSSRDSTWKVWDLNTGDPVRVRGGHGGIVTGIVVSPDGHQLATSGADKLIRLWDSNTLKQVNLFQGHGEVVTCLAFAPCGSMLISGSGDRSVRLWDTSDGSTRRIFPGHSHTISTVAFAPDGRYIVSGSFDKTVRVWDVSTGDQLSILSNHTGRVSIVAVSPDASHIVSASWDKTVRVWDASRYDQVSVLRGATKTITSLAISPQGLQQIAACSNDKTIRLWDASPSPSSAFASGAFLEGAGSNGHLRGISTIAISHDGQQLATAGYDASVRTCDASTGKSIGVPLRVHTKVVAAIAFSPNGRYLASSSWDHTLRLWNNWGTNWSEQSEITHGHQAIITCLVFLPSGQLVSGSADRTIRLWDVDSGLKIRTFHGHTRCVRSVACSIDGSMIVSGSEDFTVRIWSTTQELKAVFKGHVAAVACVTFSPTGHQIASASEDRTIRLWDLIKTASDPIMLQGHLGGVQCIAYSPCGELLASGSDDNTSIIWSVSSGSRLAIIGEVFGSISSIVWMREKAEPKHGEKKEPRVIIGCNDGSIRAWRLLVEEEAQVQLEWGTGFGHLVATKARIGGVKGLGSVVRGLLIQRGAVEEQAIST